MEALICNGTQLAGRGLSAKMGSASNVCSCSSAVGCSVPSGSGKTSNMIRLHVLDRSKINERFKRSRESYNGPLMPFRVRAEQPSGGSSVDEKVKEIASDEAVEGPGNQDRNAKLKADELRDSAGDQTSSELPVVAELLLATLKAEDENADEAVSEQNAARAVASDSAVEEPETFFHDVEEEAQKVSEDLGRGLDEEIVALVDNAEDLEKREELDAEVVKQYHGGDGSSPSEGPLPSSRAEAQEKLVETAKDGYEVLKWAAEGVVSAGKNARGGLGVAKEAFDKRVKSFKIAADETRDVSSQVAETAQKKLEEIHSSTSQFGEELKVNLDDKKAADSLKPEHERNPLTKVEYEVKEKFSEATSEDSPLGQLGREIKDNYNKVTSEDGPLAQVTESLSENLTKASQAGQDFTTRVSERAAKLTDKAKENAGDVTSNGDVRDQLKGDYEDESGNELLKGQISSSDETTNLSIDADEPQAVPSKKGDELEIGHDE